MTPTALLPAGQSIASTARSARSADVDLSPEPTVRRWARRVGFAGLGILSTLIFGLFFCYPVAVLLIRGLTDGGHLDLGATWAALTRPRILRILLFTVCQAAASAGLCLGLGLPAAYLLYCKRFPGRAVIRALLTVPFVLPTVVIGLAFRTLLTTSGPLGSWHLDQTVWSILAAHVCIDVSVVIRTVGTAWMAIDNRPAEAAASLGARPFKVFRTVTLPALGPSVASAGILAFLFCATSFGIIQILGGSRYGTIETEIYHQALDVFDLRTAAALSFVQLLLVGATLIVAGRFRARPGGRTVRAAAGRLGWRDLPAALLALVTAAVVLTAPITMAVRAFRVDGRWSTANFRALGSLGDSNVLLVPVSTALKNSLEFALLAAAGSLIVGLALAVVLAKRGRAARLIESIVMLPLGVSAVTVGFGFLLAFNRPPLNFRGSVLMVPLAQGLLAIPLIVRILLPILAAIDDRLRQAAAVLGSAPLRVWRAVDLPVAARALAGAFAFAFAVALGEFGAASFLTRPETPTLPVVIGRLLAHPSATDLGKALAASTVLAVLCVFVVAVIDVLPGRQAHRDGRGPAAWF